MSVKKALLTAAVIGFAGTGSAHASTLTATTNFPIGGNGSFVIEFDDTNNNSLFDLFELTSFSGFTSSFGQSIVSIVGVPEIAGISVAGLTPGAINIISTFWNFEELGAVDLKADLGASTGNWRYEISGVTPVPVPAALPLLAFGLGALGFAGWRRKRKAAAA